MVKPINKDYNISYIPNQGRFGGVRKHDIHTGVDLYCNDGEPVYAIEAGVVVNVVKFTGEKAGSPWWNDTYAILIEGESGVILYGELKKPWTFIGSQIYEGQDLGFVKQVLKVDKGLPMSMLHIELYAKGYRGEGEWWIDEKPEALRNIEEVLTKIY